MKPDPLKYAATRALEDLKARQPADITERLEAIRKRNAQDAAIAIFTMLLLILAGSGAALFFGGGV